MIYHGRVNNGRIEFDNHPPLAEGTLVRIEPVMEEVEKAADKEDTRTIWEKMDDLAGLAEGLPEDLAERHDHYRRLRNDPSANDSE